MTCDGAQGGKDSGWGARTWLYNSFIPGLALSCDIYQERTKDTVDHTIQVRGGPGGPGGGTPYR